MTAMDLRLKQAMAGRCLTCGRPCRVRPLYNGIDGYCSPGCRDAAPAPVDYTRKQDAESFRAGCLAMSRFLFWVWMEAMAAEWVPPARPAARLRDLAWAVESGKLRLVWP